jgi:hypothetical protein
MGTVLRYIVDDIAKDLKQVFDDKIVQQSQIAYWVLMVANRLKSQHIAKRDSGAYMHTFSRIPILTHSSVSNPDEVNNRKYILLPKSIYDYDSDGGIEYISYYVEDDKPSCPPPFTRQTFTRTTPSTSQRLYYTEDEKPSPSNPYFYRTGSHLYFLGIECVDAEYVEIGIYNTLDPIDKIDIDSELDFPDELIIILKRQVLDLGRFTLMLPQERVNDGSDDGARKGIPTNKLVSVNELSEDTPNNK